jgi:hypothetical protein
MIYVDPCIHRWKGQRWCHMFADTDKELHAFAKRIGLKRAWFQSDGRLPHYDINENRRSRAVELGATEVTIRFVACRIKANAKAFRSRKVH